MSFPDTPVLRPAILWALIVCLGVAMAPWYTGGQQSTGMLLAGGTLLLGLLLAWRQPDVRRLPSGALRWFYGGILLWAAASWFWTANRYSTVVWTVVWGLAGLAFYLSYLIAESERGREWLVRLYVVSAVSAAVYGMWLYATEGYDRLVGPFYWANPMAAYLLPALLVAIDRLGQERRVRWMWLAVSLVVGAAFALTDSRATTLVLAVVFMLYAVVRRPALRHWVMILFMVGGTLLLTLGMGSVRSVVQSAVNVTTPGLRFGEAARGEAHSLSDRINYLQSAVEMWKDHPVEGIGAGTYGDVHPQYQQRVVSASNSAHNFYVQTIAELGIVGAVGLMGLMTMVAWEVLKALMKGWGQTLPLALGLLGLLLHIGVDIDARYPALVLLVGVLAGLIYRLQDQVRMPMSWRPVVLAGLVMMPLVGLHLSSVWAEKARVSQEANEYERAAMEFAVAHQWPVYNPDTINAEGINRYSEALVNERARRDEAALALDRARRAQREDPRDAQHHQLEGRVLLLQGDLTGAEKALRKALELDSYNHPVYAHDLATVLYRQGRPHEAIKVARRMAEQYTDDVVANRNYDLSLRPILATLWVMIGEEAVRQRQIPEAIQATERALKLEPKDQRGLMLRALVMPARVTEPDGPR